MDSPMNRSRRSARTSDLLVAAALASVVGACTSAKDPGPAATSPAVVRLLRASGACVLDAARGFEPLAAQLAAAATAYEQAPSPENLAGARERWRAAAAGWAVLEPMQFGPNAAASKPGGRDLRESVYAWPLISRCFVEQAIVARTYARPDFASALPSVRGLGALEYLLFHEGADNACPATAAINSQGTWAALDAVELGARKRAYARAAAADLAASASKVRAAWEPGDGAFTESHLATAGSIGSVYPSASAALNAVTDAMFYLETEVKDQKLAKPAGISGCGTTTCPEALEAPFARNAKVLIGGNLDGFRLLYEGCGADGYGIDDHLRANGLGALATRMAEALAGAKTSLEALPFATLEEALAVDRTSVLGVHAALKAVTDLLKSELVGVLDVEIPRRVEGDND
jgi:predicted lipoprotein